ncbi:hypothetical protein CRG98_018988 [Punica granatum]|uniref:Uncharacterized protein n=1 Tax=Punica granatum TaxID=22663 RepID=A0A2I0JWD7_PUNGR|nr:hypothetical protein CRG98_018988 [Punica granatum]
MHALLPAWDCPPSRGCVTDTGENESPYTILRPEARGPVSYPGLGVWDTPNLLRQWSCGTGNSEFGGSITCGPISCTPFRHFVCLGLVVFIYLPRGLRCTLLARFDTVNLMKRSVRVKNLREE